MRNTDALRRICSDYGVDSIYEQASTQWLALNRLHMYKGAGLDSDKASTVTPAAGAVAALTVAADDPSIEPQENGIVLDGCKRMRALHKAGYKRVLCLVAGRPLDSLQRMLVRIMLNQGRELVCAEKLALIMQLNSTDIPSGYTDMVVNVVTAHDKEAALLKCAGRLDEKTVRALQQESFSLQTAPLFEPLEQSQRHVIIDTFSDLMLSLQHQRDLLQWLPEIAYTRQCSIEALCSDKAVAQLCSDNTLNGPQKIARIKSHFHSLRYPSLDRMQRKRRRLVSQHNPDTSRVKFTHAPAFEKDGCTVTVSLCFGDDAPALFSRLAGIERSVWNELIAPCSCCDAAADGDR